MRRLGLLFAIVHGAGCASGTVASPSIEIALLPARAGLGGARRLQVVADRPVRATVHLWDGARHRTLPFAPFAPALELPLLGLHPDAEASVAVEVTDRAGRTTLVPPVSFATDPLPERFPDIEVLALDPERVEPGELLFVVRSPEGGASFLVVLDREARPVWWADLAPQFGGEVSRSARGTFVGLADGALHEVDVLGEVVRTVRPDGEPLHHELVELPDGTFLSLRTAPFVEPDYPTDPADPLGPTAPALLEDHEVVRFDGAGAVLTAWKLSDVLDTTRVSAQSFDPAGRDGRLDWAHANGLAPTEDGGVLVSVRHQDAVVRLGPDGALRWILGDPAGWKPAWEPFLLAPVGDLDWPYHTHAPALAPDGAVVVYDNHNHGATLYEPLPEAPQFSRAAAFRVDEDEGTVALLWEHTHTTTGRLWTPANGDVDLQPLTGNRLVDFGFVTREEDVENEEAGRGARSVRLVEFAPDGTPVLDLRLSGKLDEEPMGWQAFRAERIPGLYPPGVLDPAEDDEG